MVSGIKLAIGENIYDGYRRVILNKMAISDYFPRLRIFSLLFAVDILSDRQVANTAHLLLIHPNQTLACKAGAYLSGPL